MHAGIEGARPTRHLACRCYAVILPGVSTQRGRCRLHAPGAAGARLWAADAGPSIRRVARVGDKQCRSGVKLNRPAAMFVTGQTSMVPVVETGECAGRLCGCRFARSEKFGNS